MHLAAAAAHPVPAGFVYRGGFLPAGDDLPHLAADLTEEEAAGRCAADERCAGFTYQREERVRDGGRAPMLFKSVAEFVATTASWHTLKRSVGQLDCSPAGRPPPPPPVTLTIGVLHEDPPIYVVDGFVPPEWCAQVPSFTTILYYCTTFYCTTVLH